MTLSPTESVRESVVVPVAPDRAFELYVDRPGRTHPEEGRSGRPARIVYEPRDGGRWYEIGSDGIEHEWGQVLTWDPPRRLVLGWMVGAATGEWAYDPDPAHASLAEITFEPTDGGTLVTVVHSGFERHGPSGVDIRRGVSTGWGRDLADLLRAAAA